MASFKVILIAFLAFGALQCQAASVIEPEPEDLDILLAAQQVIKIVKNVIAAVEKGINDSKPSVDVIIQQLTPELGKAVKNVWEKALGLVRSERDRVEFMIKEVEGLLDAVKKIRSCTDPQKKNIEKVVGKLEDGLLAVVRDNIKTHNESLQDVRTGFKRILNKARNLFDTEINNFIGCIKPGHPNAQKCIDGELEKIKKAIVGLGADILLFYSEAQEVLVNFVTSTAQSALPVIDTFKKEADPIMKSVSDCIAKMKGEGRL